MSSRVCLIIYDLPVYISSCLFSLMWSGLLVIPGVSCLWVLPSPVMSCLDVLIKYYIWVYILVCVFLFLPRVCTVTEDQTITVSGAHSPRFVFRFEKFLFCSSVFVCLSRGMEVAARHSRHSPLQVGVGVRRDRRECRESTGREPSLPADCGRYPSPAGALPSPPAACLVPGLPLPQARRSREITPPDRLWLNARRPASVSMPAGPPLSQSPPDCRWLKPAGLPLTQARRIAADSSPLDRRWLMPAGRRYP